MCGRSRSILIASAAPGQGTMRLHDVATPFSMESKIAMFTASCMPRSSQLRISTRTSGSKPSSSELIGVTFAGSATRSCCRVASANRDRPSSSDHEDRAGAGHEIDVLAEKADELTSFRVAMAQHALVVLGVDVVQVEPLAQEQPAAEAPVRPLGGEHLVVLAHLGSLEKPSHADEGPRPRPLV